MSETSVTQKDGWNCQKCGAYVKLGAVHRCPPKTIHSDAHFIFETEPREDRYLQKLDAIIALLKETTALLRDIDYSLRTKLR